jgi:spermidine synthase
MMRLWRPLLFFVFFLSGFSSLVYQVVWTRLAFASFGIITPVLSVVLSVFMLGLALGSWWGGRRIAGLVDRSRLSAAFFYGASEFTIGIGALAAPMLFDLSQRILLPAGQMDSFAYLLLSAVALAISIFPWCFCMGTTFPFMMAYVRENDTGNTSSFSFLYVANVLGAMCGTFATAAFLIELLGFHHTLWVAAGGNFIIAIISACLGFRSCRPVAATAAEAQAQSAKFIAQPDALPVRTILFSTGFISMAMEVVWFRDFTPVLRTQVYSFALIVFTYLLATFLGSLTYRMDLAKHRARSVSSIFALLAVGAFFPVLVNDARFVTMIPFLPEIRPANVLALLASIVPFCAALGYLTPNLIDRYAAGNPRDAGYAYAVNVLGCILGPLVAGYLLLPFLSERVSLIILSSPFVAYCWLTRASFKSGYWRLAIGSLLLAELVWAMFFTMDFEVFCLRRVRDAVVRRDYVASVVSCGAGFRKILCVNGIAMTTLSPVTKFIADLPLAFHSSPPKSALVICFGMGTSFRTTLRWNIDTTAVELVPSVIDAFGFYHWDAAECLTDPNAHVVVDDGRRYLRRCGRSFDVIIVDPPPPVEAAGSSLLFSTDFYALAKQHLNPNGVVQMWFPGADDANAHAVVRAMVRSFPYVRCFSSVEGWGLHILGSMEPIPKLTSRQFLDRMPAAAQIDLMEWTAEDPVAYVDHVLGHEIPVEAQLRSDPSIVVTDDQPFNEYFWIRSLRGSPNAAFPGRAGISTATP